MDDRKQRDHRPAGGRTAPAAGNTPEPADARPWELPEYVHERQLGAGAGGRVVLARHRATGTPVAVKYLHSTAGTPALRAEAEVLAGLDSPHVTRLYEYVESEHGAAIVMELVDGIALRELLRAEGATTPEAALVVLKGSLLGLAAAHGAGVVHRDYKPANVLVDTAGTSKLVDFGIAVPSGDERDVSGTPAYMPPEQWAGRPASPAGDVYAATVTFFECLTGARPYGGTTFAELAVQHTEAPIPAELTPDPVRPLILSGLAKDPGARPDSATALLAELEGVAAAGYGPGWEEKGRLDLTALVALLALLLPGAGAAVGGTSLAHTALGGGESAALDSSGAGSSGAGASTSQSSTSQSSAVQSAAGKSAASQSSAGTGAAPPAVVRETLIRRAARTGTRGKTLTGVAAGALTLATLAGMAVAGAVDGDSRTVVGGAAPEATTSIGPFDPAGAASPVASPAATEGQDTPGPGPSDPSATPAPDASSSGAAGSGPPSPGVPSTGPGSRSTGPTTAPTGRTSPGTPPGSGTPGAPGTARPPLPPGSAVPSSGPAVPVSVPPSSAPPATAPATGPVVAPSSATPAGPTSTAPSPTPTVLPTRTVAPTVAVSSVNLDSLACAGRWSTTATVTVVAQGAATGSLTLTWFHTLGERTVDVATDTVAVHDGRATVSRTHDFTSADTFPTWGVRIGTAPAATRPGRTSDTVAAFLCDPPR
ncbi:protein kinase domain-containing protein [Kitasatospora purpeofusca]|uniref:protein kinase domain-containing protein n=1 Tax=Kitasatospora purpeofusca TaxID=67352 RepID=UPI0038664613